MCWGVVHLDSKVICIFLLTENPRRTLLSWWHFTLRRGPRRVYQMDSRRTSVMKWWNDVTSSFLWSYDHDGIHLVRWYVPLYFFKQSQWNNHVSTCWLPKPRRQTKLRNHNFDTQNEIPNIWLTYISKELSFGKKETNIVGRTCCWVDLIDSSPAFFLDPTVWSGPTTCFLEVSGLASFLVTWPQWDLVYYYLVGARGYGCWTKNRGKTPKMDGENKGKP